MIAAPLSWFQIFRLGLVQMALGSIVVLTTSTLNRIMVVELALPATVPGILVALHYALQVLRPRLGYGSDIGGRLTPWIIGGMALLALGGTGAAAATAWMSVALLAGIALAVLSFFMIGIGVGACGTSLLVLLAKRLDDQRRVAGATVVWLMMIAGFVATTAIAGYLLDPYTPGRLVAVAAAVSVAALALTVAAIWTIEDDSQPVAPTARAAETARGAPFVTALVQVWSEPSARRFAIFIFISMLAYSAPELILEPFAGSVFGLTPGESTTLASVLHGGTLAGMALTALACGMAGRGNTAALPAWTAGGCTASGVALLTLAIAGFAAPMWPLRACVFMLGLGNGVYAVAAIGSMMSLAGAGQRSREGLRMGLWGAAQAIAFGLGGFIGTLAYDVARTAMASAALAYASVFAADAVLFAVSAVLAIRIRRHDGAAAVGNFAGIATLSASDAGVRRS